MTEYGLAAQIALTALLTLLGIWISVVFIRWMVGFLRVKADQRQILRLVNQGNTACQYHLSVKTAAPNLKFTLYSQGDPLAQVYEEIEEEEEVVEEQRVEEDNTKSASPSSIPAQNANDQSATKTEKPNADGAMKAGKDVSVKSGILANFLGILGSVLPGSLGASMKGAAGNARKVQSTSAKAVQAPKSAQRKMNAMKSSSGKLGVKANDTKSTDTAKPRVGARQMRETRKQADFSRTTRNVVKKVKRTVEKIGVVQTVDVNPGESLALTLEIRKDSRRYPTGSFGYTLESQPVPLNKRLGEAPAAIKKGQVHFPKIAQWRYWMPSLGVILYLVLLALSAYYSILFIWA